MSDRVVYRNRKGGWNNKRVGADRAGSVHGTQAEAIREARDNLRNAGGGELTVMGIQGKIRSKDTIAPGNDPFPPRG